MRKLASLGATAWIFALAGALLQCGGTSGGVSIEPVEAGPVPAFGSSPLGASWAMPVREHALATSAVATDADGNLYVAGTLYGTTDLGLGPMVSAGGGDVLVAKLDAAGHPVWSKRFGDALDQIVAGVATDPAGNVIVSGSFAGTLDFGNGKPLTSVLPVPRSTSDGRGITAIGGRDAFVAKLDRSGEVVWSLQLGDVAANAEPRAVAAGGAGEIAVAGYFDRVVSVAAPYRAAIAPRSTFLTLIDPSGAIVWKHTWNEGITIEDHSVAVDPFGDVLATGTFSGTIDLGAGQHTSHGGRDVFLAKFCGIRAVRAAEGLTLYSKTFGDGYDDYAAGVAVDREGNVLTLGQYTGVIDLGTGPVSAHGSTIFYGSSDVFVAKYDRAGDALWADGYGAVDRVDWADALAVDADGNVYFSARIYNPMTVGPCSAAPTIAETVRGQAVVAEVTAAGAPVCVRRYGDGAWSQVRSIAPHPTSGLILVGAFEGTIDLGQGVIASGDGPGGFIVHESVFPPPQPLQ